VSVFIGEIFIGEESIAALGYAFFGSAMSGDVDGYVGGPKLFQYMKP
jgi:hypothetical protein